MVPGIHIQKNEMIFLNITTSVELTLQCTCADPENFPGVIRSERIILFFRGRGDSEAYFREFTM